MSLKLLGNYHQWCVGYERVAVLLFCGYDKICDKGNLSEKGFILGSQSTVELEAADHIASITRKQRAINASSSSAHFLYLHSSGFKPGNGGVLNWSPITISTIKMIHHRHARSPITQLIPDAVKLIITSNHIAKTTPRNICALFLWLGMPISECQWPT